ncbi:hypothetical protein BAXH7_01930 [Bacillus amyloliquefaciens XH7]|nr:hypothetical protein LL3_01691 [Bacillus amyloliquefaciens LL3]AEK89062.1 hypothetical protein BAXH7_01930 [Bacillus amyloliquefaciens XH7]KYC94661.1 hypothetical protein B425_1575 [Bacillus amyloliquefaciens]QBG56003.1 hypothetical protein D2M30_1673 [Bacillus amyloliquefaciens]
MKISPLAVSKKPFHQMKRVKNGSSSAFFTASLRRHDPDQVR